MHLDQSLVSSLSKMVEKVENFPKPEFVFRSFLIDDSQTEMIKLRLAREYKTLIDLMQLENSPLKDLTFEQLFFSADHF